MADNDPQTPEITEKDLMALKSKLEKAEKQLKDAKDSHRTELEAAESKYNEAYQKVLQAEAKVTSLEEQISQSGNSAEELKTVKQQLEDANKSVEDLTGKVLEGRRTAIVSTYNIPADNVKEKTLQELDNYEDALKAVIATKGIGNYAVGGGGGGAETPLSAIDQAKQELKVAREQQAKRRSGDTDYTP